VVSPPVKTTNYFPPTANAPVSGGDNNGFELNPANAYTTDGLFAVDANSGTGTSSSCTGTGKDSHDFFSYGGFGVPTSGVTIRGIEVKLNARVDGTTGAPKICVQLSWNGGTSWTAAQQTTTLTTTNTAYVLGGSTTTWGRTWTPANFLNANFRVRIIDVATSTARTFSLDAISVRVTYQ